MASKIFFTALLVLCLALSLSRAVAWAASGAVDRPWMNRALTPDRRAELLLDRMTTDEKLHLLISTARRPNGEPLGLAGFVPGIARLGLPALRETNAELGVAIPMQNGMLHPEDEATALPSGLATAASWNPRIAYANGAMIGTEARRKGFNVLLAGAANLARDPRAGRNFEYAGEDPLLTGIMVGAAIRGIQEQHIISTLKHFALNDQETDRTTLDARIDPAALRESDLLAFEIAYERGAPGAVMCAYNRVGGEYSCENGELLTHILRQQWGFRGWVMSDWGAVHSTARAVHAGLDQESGVEWDSRAFFGDPLAAALAEGAVTQAQLDTMVRRILRSMFASGVIDDPPARVPIDVDADAKVAERAAEQGIVLLQNRLDLLPLSHGIRSIAVIGGHADIGVLSGGGSSQVIPIGGPALQIDYSAHGSPIRYPMIFDPSSPLRAIAAEAPDAKISYADGHDLAKAAALARHAAVAIVFATKWESEGSDSDDLSLPSNQDGLIAAVAAANPRTIVVLETGNPVVMPWRGKVSTIIEAWYPGARGGEAIARILFGEVDPSGRLPMTFPASAAQLPRPQLPGRGNAWNTSLAIHYGEGADIGYKWFALRHLTPLYPFGFGLSYTRFRYSDLRVHGRTSLSATFTVTNSGSRSGADVPQLYAYIPEPGQGAVMRLIGWRKLNLAPGQSERVTVAVDPRLLAHFDVEAQNWSIDAGTYRVALGASARDLRLTATAPLTAQTLPP